jgi:hypothetical protein
MPDTPSTLIHYRAPGTTGTACDQHNPEAVQHSDTDPGGVTCFACRKTDIFKAGQMRVGTPTPLPQRQAPKLLKDIVAEDPELSELERKAWKAALPAAKNCRGMYVIEEFIHHGEYRSTRRVEVYDINAVTVDAVIQSSAYCYGSWLHPENPDHKQPRNTKLHQLVGLEHFGLAAAEAGHLADVLGVVGDAQGVGTARYQRRPGPGLGLVVDWCCVRHEWSSFG